MKRYGLIDRRFEGVAEEVYTFLVGNNKVIGNKTSLKDIYTFFEDLAKKKQVDGFVFKHRNEVVILENIDDIEQVLLKTPLYRCLVDKKNILIGHTAAEEVFYSYYIGPNFVDFGVIVAPEDLEDPDRLTELAEEMSARVLFPDKNGWYYGMESEQWEELLKSLRNWVAEKADKPQREIEGALYDSEGYYYDIADLKLTILEGFKDEADTIFAFMRLEMAK